MRAKESPSMTSVPTLQRQGKNGKDEGPQYACGPEKGVQAADAAQQSLELGSKVHDTSIG